MNLWERAAEQYHERRCLEAPTLHIALSDSLSDGQHHREVLHMLVTLQDTDLVTFEPWQPHGTWRSRKTRFSLPTLEKVKVSGVSYVI